MSESDLARVERACAEMVEAGAAPSFATVASRARLSRSTIYRRPELRAIVDEHRSRAREARTLSGLVVELDQLRRGLEALAATVRRNEERLRTLERRARAQ